MTGNLLLRVSGHYFRSKRGVVANLEVSEAGLLLVAVIQLLPGKTCVAIMGLSVALEVADQSVEVMI